jgi:putative membrane protein
MSEVDHKDFWNEVFAWRNTVSPWIVRRLTCFGLIAAAVWYIGTNTSLIPHSDIAPYELIGAALAVLLMLRTNTGYDRWYEGRKLWGGIVNQSRNLAQIGLTYGPSDPEWRSSFARWVAAFPHACRHSLRGERALDDMQDLLGDETDDLRSAPHLPLYVAQRLANLLREALDDERLDRFAFMQAETQRAMLIDHIGACERILKTPLAKALSVKIRRFLVIYLIALPFGIFDRAGVMTPMIVMLVAYPLLSLDQISVDLQNPFSVRRVSHLPLTEICRNIEANVMTLLDSDREESRSSRAELRTPIAV